MTLRILDRMRRQYAVYWPRTGITAGGDGEPTFGKPFEIKVRWEERVSLIRFGGQFKDMGFRDAVYLPPRPADAGLVEVGGFLWRGRLRDCPTAKKAGPPYDPKAGDDQTAKEITAYTEIPSVRAKKFLRVAIL